MNKNCISGVMESVPCVQQILVSSPGWIKLECHISICCFSAKYAELKSNKVWLDRDQDNVSDWSDMSAS